MQIECPYCKKEQRIADDTTKELFRCINCQGIFIFDQQRDIPREARMTDSISSPVPPSPVAEFKKDKDIQKQKKQPPKKKQILKIKKILIAIIGIITGLLIILLILFFGGTKDIDEVVIQGKKISNIPGRYMSYKKGNKISLKLKRDGTALFDPISGIWRAEWQNQRRQRVWRPPFLKLNLFRNNGYITDTYYYTCLVDEWRKFDKRFNIDKIFNKRKVGKIEEGIEEGDVRIISWDWIAAEVETEFAIILRAQPGSNLIVLDKVWDSVEGTVYPGQVEIYDNYEYVSESTKGQILELEETSNFKSSPWYHGRYFLYELYKWQIQDNKIQVKSQKNSFELEIEDDVLVDKENDITFVKQD